MHCYKFQTYLGNIIAPICRALPYIDSKASSRKQMLRSMWTKYETYSCHLVRGIFHWFLHRRAVSRNTDAERNHLGKGHSISWDDLGGVEKKSKVWVEEWGIHDGHWRGEMWSSGSVAESPESPESHEPERPKDVAFPKSQLWRKSGFLFIYFFLRLEYQALFWVIVTSISALP